MASEKTNIENDEIEIDLYGFFLKFRDNLGKIFICTILGAVLALAYSLFLVNSQYQSTSMVYVRGSQTSISLQDLQVGSQLTNDYEVIFTSRPVLEAVINDCNLDLSVKDLAERITITNPEETRILQISATGDTPKEACDITNSVMEHGVEKILEIESQEPYVIEKAIENGIPIGTSKSKFMLFGAVGGFVVSTGLLFAYFVISDHIKSVEDVERALELPVLAVIAEDDSLNVKPGRKRDSRKGGKA